MKQVSPSFLGRHPQEGTDGIAAVKQAQAQICRYADTVNVNDHIGPTRLHKVYVVYRGVEMVACEGVTIKQ